MSFVGNFVPQVGDDLVEGLEVADVLAHYLFGKGVWFFADQGVECFLIVGHNFPGGADTGEYLGQVLDPTVEILVLKFEDLVFPAVGLQSDAHLGILFDEEVELKLLIFHMLINISME